MTLAAGSGAGGAAPPRLVLWGARGTTSTIPHLLLAEAGAAFETRFLSLKDGEQRRPDYLAVNPKGEVPALVVGDKVVTEIPAICVFIAETHPAAGLLPSDPLEKALALSWLQWCSFRQAQGFFPAFMPQRFIEGETEAAKLRAASVGRVAEAMRQAGEALSRSGGYLGGERPGLADYYLFMQERWAVRAFRLDLPEECRAHYARMAARPAVARVMEAEGLEA
ncbi:glutathione S-transferase family protein [Roseomonas gilardii subsp. gilardii]|uniref:glutathione S-transferase family protein n=1 Tax=Roseomonas gilardii TaxID=257708 RepID=UPI001FF8A661|nr:glutathione S-transferase family protein [Roseomonas gilardii]UPG72463.1 glutathione S-transferase family protein [Roseomonas gilardii subsp. gilardii]